ncbi:MAG: hypothetical protein CBC81_000580 [Flavobacteriaceae bacterium TMED121]|nr:hypothetical protein [Candidatus Neomarinimicrobiota bacterium]RPG67418.1 MAG: hypothetical protein CBC81_000580 [Flavobacteriaceae bacterium TMED121]
MSHNKDKVFVIKFSVLLVLTLFTFSCNTIDFLNNNSSQDNERNCIDNSRIDNNAACIEIYDPVCGCNNKTYSNSCYAEKDGVAEWTKGACK